MKQRIQLNEITNKTLPNAYVEDHEGVGAEYQSIPFHPNSIVYDYQSSMPVERIARGLKQNHLQEMFH